MGALEVYQRVLLYVRMLVAFATAAAVDDCLLFRIVPVGYRQRRNDAFLELLLDEFQHAASLDCVDFYEINSAG